VELTDTYLRSLERANRLKEIETKNAKCIVKIKQEAS